MEEEAPNTPMQDIVNNPAVTKIPNTHEITNQRLIKDEIHENNIKNEQEDVEEAESSGNKETYQYSEGV